MKQQMGEPMKVKGIYVPQPNAFGKAFIPADDLQEYTIGEMFGYMHIRIKLKNGKIMAWPMGAPIGVEFEETGIATPSRGVILPN